MVSRGEAGGERGVEGRERGGGEREGRRGVGGEEGRKGKRETERERSKARGLPEVKLDLEESPRPPPQIFLWP